MKNLIIGAGEVGQSLLAVLKDHHETYIRDVEGGAPNVIEVLNIAFPCKDVEAFKGAVRGYQNLYQPSVTIIHSTVPPGTSRELGAVHSPIHGLHPDLSEGIKTFTKYVGGEDPEHVDIADKFLRAAGIVTKVVRDPETSELSKILCTTRYGWEIAFMKEVEKICKKYKVNFKDVYEWAHEYNAGYTKLGKGHFHRSVLKPMEGKIGGHCIMQNAKLIPEEELAQILITLNETY